MHFPLLIPYSQFLSVKNLIDTHQVVLFRYRYEISIKSKVYPAMASIATSMLTTIFGSSEADKLIADIQ